VFPTGFEAFGQLTPRRHRVVTTAATFALTLTATHRVIDWVHYHTTNVRTDTQPAATTRFAGRNIHVVGIANLANGRKAIFVDAAHFTRS
jgi:hypothetical protein